MPTRSLNPLEAWTSASLSANAAALEMATNATSLALSFYSALASPRAHDETGRTSAPIGSTPVVPFTPRPGARREASAASEAGALRGAMAPAGAGRQTGTRQHSPSAGRSWYRAPYRSPFDPLFWMMPGHPVDHIGDWIGVVMAATAPQLGVLSPRSASPLVANPFSPFAAGPFSTPQLPTWPVSAWLEMVGATSRSSAAALPWLGGADVVDRVTASPAYRTAGGHAIAPVVQPGGAEAQARSIAPGALFMPMLWPWLVASGPTR